MQLRFIQLSLKPKLNLQGKPTGAFTIDQLRQDALRNITVTRRGIDSDISDTVRSKHILPANYMHLLADSSILLTDCGKDKKSSYQVLVQCINFPEALGSAPYFTSLSITVNGVTVSIPGSLEQYHQYQSTTNKADISFLTSFILYKLREQGVEAYWEKYDDIYKQNCLIVPNGAGISLSYNGTAITNNVTTVTKNVTSTELLDGGIEKANRLGESAKVFELNQTAFYQSNMQSPLSELENNILWVYNGKNFIVTKTNISYIRKPKPISLILGCNCEIAEEFHQTICDLTVEYLMNRIQEKDGVQLSTMDIENRVIL